MASDDKYYDQGKPVRQLVVFDARPQVNAAANAAKGGGWENSRLYHGHCRKR